VPATTAHHVTISWTEPRYSQHIPQQGAFTRVT
jgi:hypothetical protein